MISSNDDRIEDATNRLIALEIKARRKKQYSVANNICLDFSYKANGVEKIKLLDTVISSEGDDYYNKIKVIVYKIKYLATPDKINSISGKDCLNISIAYSYLYSQRFVNLFNLCHEAIWNLLVHANQYDKLLKLFMHSSFLWRIRGEFEKEAEYIVALQQLEIPSHTNCSNELRYFFARTREAPVKSLQ